MNRASLAERFVDTSSSPLKTFVIEVHASGDRGTLLRELAAGGMVAQTDDRYIFRLAHGEVEFWIDTLDARFWSFHTWSSTQEAGRFLKAQLEQRRDLDWMWLPSAHLRDIWPGGMLRSLLSEFRGDRILPIEAPARDVRLQVEGAASGNLLEWIAGNPQFTSTGVV